MGKRRGEGKRSTALEFLASMGYLDGLTKTIFQLERGAKIRLALYVTAFQARTNAIRYPECSNMI